MDTKSARSHALLAHFVKVMKDSGRDIRVVSAKTLDETIAEALHWSRTVVW